MLWFIIGIAIFFGIVSAMLKRRSSTFQDPDANERQIQEEERIKASSWFGGGQ
ncbi:hypothetical protein [Bacillus sp. Marseille-Q1617]|uniref:hypothetical protein n=1 Tax=Bacillus sp. Marseille-Q1617 TaxID=2736887 RepID=UPI00158F0463|nr:hypothetical protein [Bacillus sp. Marseille-Q1617]